MFEIIDKIKSTRKNTGSIHTLIPITLKGPLPRLRKYRTKKQTEKAFGKPSKRRDE